MINENTRLYIGKYTIIPHIRSSRYHMIWAMPGGKVFTYPQIERWARSINERILTEKQPISSTRASK